MHRSISICLIVILAVTYLLYGNKYVLAMLIAIGILLILNFLYNLYISRKIEVRCRLDGVIRDRKASVEITVLNLTRFPVMFLGGQIRVINTYTGEESKEKFNVPLSPGRDNKIIPDVTVPSCGKYSFAVKGIRLKDVFGIISLPIKAMDQCNFTVMPNLYETVVEYDMHESETFDNDTYSPYRKGQDRSEVYQIREYKEGDPLNQIHWKLTSKLDKPIVKDASFPISRSMAIIFDKSSPNEVTAKIAEAMAEILVSTGEYLIGEGSTFQLLWNDSEAESIESREIQFDNDFVEAIPQLLTGTIKKSDENFADLHELILGSMTASHIIYICSSDRVLPDSVVGQSRVTKLIGSDPGYRENYRNVYI